MNIQWFCTILQKQDTSRVLVLAKLLPNLFQLAQYWGRPSPNALEVLKIISKGYSCGHVLEYKNQTSYCNQSPPFLLALQVKEILKLVEHLQVPLLVMSAMCIVRNRHLAHFSPLHHTDSFALFYEYKDQSLGKQK